MGYPEVTYTFSDTETLDASEINTNFTNLVDSTKDTSKNIHIASLAISDQSTLTGTLSSSSSLIANDIQTNESCTLANIFSTSSIIDILNLPSQAVTISSGVFSVSKSLVILNGEAGAADNLDTINGGIDGSILILMKKSTSGDITVKNVTGNLVLGSDKVLSAFSTMILVYDIGLAAWIMISHSSNT